MMRVAVVVDSMLRRDGVPLRAEVPVDVALQCGDGLGGQPVRVETVDATVLRLDEELRVADMMWTPVDGAGRFAPWE